ncbi:MAG: hypothetical protein AAGA75_20835 [Cyanobacteria bacterium P01_E01_bin.6]
MNSTQHDHNANCIDREITYFNTILEQRFKLLFDGDPSTEDLLHALLPPDIQEIDTPYAEVVRTLNLHPAERLVLILSFIPHIKPHLLDSFFIRNQSLDSGFTEFGGITGNSHGVFYSPAKQLCSCWPEQTSPSACITIASSNSTMF